MANKITISLDEVQSSTVDEKLRQTAGSRGQATSSAEAGGIKWRQLLYNTLVYSTLFGLVAGVVAALVGEIFIQMSGEGVQVEYGEYLSAREDLEGELEAESISQAEFDRRVLELRHKYSGNPFVDIESNAANSEYDSARQIDELIALQQRRGLVGTAYWFVSIGMLLALGLSIADQAMGHNLRGVFVNGSVGIAIALFGSMFGGCFASILYNLLGGGDSENMTMQIIARALGWGVLGLCLSAAPGIVLKNWKRSLIGLSGGLIGGTLGGALFDPIEMLTGSVPASRIVAITAIGALTGLGTGLLETAAKSGWVRVVHGLIAGKQFILYKDTTYIGSSPQCEIYLFKDTAISPRHAAIHRKGNSFELEDLRSATGTYVNGSPQSRVRIKSNDRIQIGGTVLVFLERSRGAK